jgi:hypothetical protein
VAGTAFHTIICQSTSVTPCEPTHLTGDTGAALQRAYHAPQMKAELCKKQGWDDVKFDIIDWEPFGVVTMKLEDLDRLQLFKMAHSALQVMRQQKLFDYSPTDICPRCGNEEETVTHMLKCQLRNTESWKEELQDGLKKAEIGPQTRALIMHVIKCYATNIDYNISSDYEGLAQAVCFD